MPSVRGLSHRSHEREEEKPGSEKILRPTPIAK
jgi:hypothetical protein